MFVADLLSKTMYFVRKQFAIPILPLFICFKSRIHINEQTESGNRNYNSPQNKNKKDKCHKKTPFQKNFYFKRTKLIIFHQPVLYLTSTICQEYNQ